MAVEDDFVTAVKRDMNAVANQVNQYPVTGTGDGYVTVTVEGADRNIAKVKGVAIAPGDFALVLTLGVGKGASKVAIGAVTTIGVSE